MNKVFVSLNYHLEIVLRKTQIRQFNIYQRAELEATTPDK